MVPALWMVPKAAELIVRVGMPRFTKLKALVNSPRV
jgi:hypothetical protein